MVGGRYLANQKCVNTCASYVCNMTRGFLHFRMVHAFTCAGILPTQYINFCKFAGIGGVKKSYIYSGV